MHVRTRDERPCVRRTCLDTVRSMTRSIVIGSDYAKQWQRPQRRGPVVARHDTVSFVPADDDTAAVVVVIVAAVVIVVAAAAVVVVAAAAAAVEEVEVSSAPTRRRQYYRRCCKPSSIICRSRTVICTHRQRYYSCCCTVGVSSTATVLSHVPVDDDTKVVSVVLAVSSTATCNRC